MARKQNTSPGFGNLLTCNPFALEVWFLNGPANRSKASKACWVETVCQILPVPGDERLIACTASLRVGFLRSMHWTHRFQRFVEKHMQWNVWSSHVKSLHSAGTPSQDRRELTRKQLRPSAEQYVAC